MSYQVFIDALDDLLLRLRDAQQSRNAMTMHASSGGRSIQEDLSEAIKDLADYAFTQNHQALGMKLRELEIEADDRSYGTTRLDVTQLVARILRVQRVMKTVGAGYLVTDASRSEQVAAIEGRLERPLRASSKPRRSSKVFVVHGHDNALLQEVTRLLERFGLTPVVLQEQPNRGKTVIEKFEENADVGFAVILMTGDDMGASLDDAEQKNFAPRARQNVVLELGYFAGRIGRSKVCVLKSPNVEQPSDIVGIVYTAIDREGAWKLKLGQELKAADYDIDMNRLLPH